MNLIPWLSNLLSKSDRYTELKRFSLFSELNAYELFQVNNIITQRDYKHGEILFEHGFPVEAIFFVQKGEVELIGSTQPGGKRILRQGEIIGLIDMFNASTRSCTAQSISATSVLAISRTDLNELITSNPRLGNKLLSAICKVLSSHISEFNEVV